MKRIVNVLRSVTTVRLLAAMFLGVALLLSLTALPAVTNAANPTTTTDAAPNLSDTTSGVVGTSTSSTSSTSAFVAPKVIAGHVVQGTSGETVPADMNVSLTVSDASGATLTTKTQALGPGQSFSFTGFPSKNGYRYQLGLLKGDQPELMNLDAGADPTTITITMYDTTSSAADLSVPTQVLMIPKIDPKTRQVAVLELAEIQNSGDRSFVPDLVNPPATGTMPSLLTFSLPQGYQDLRVQSDMPNGGHTVDIGHGFALVNPVLPGESRVVYRYVFPYHGASATMDHLLPLGAAQFQILYPAGQAHITVDGMAAAPDAQIGAITYKVLVAKHVPVGQRFSIQLSSLPQPSLMDSVSNFLTESAWVTVGAPALVGLAMAALLAYALILRRNRRRRAALAAPENVTDRDAAIESIALLDERYQADEVSEEEYQTQRAALLEQITTGDK